MTESNSEITLIYPDGDYLLAGYLCVTVCCGDEFVVGYWGAGGWAETIQTRSNLAEICPPQFVQMIEEQCCNEWARRIGAALE